MDESSTLQMHIFGMVLASFPVMLVVTMVMVSKYRGFSALARAYPLSPSQKLPSWAWTSASVGLLHYKGAIAFGSDRQGLYIKGMRPFVLGTNLIFIPWSDIKAESKRKVLGQTVRLTALRQPAIGVLLWRRDFERLAAQAPSLLQNLS